MSSLANESLECAVSAALSNPKEARTRTPQPERGQVSPKNASHRILTREKIGKTKNSLAPRNFFEKRGKRRHKGTKIKITRSWYIIPPFCYLLFQNLILNCPSQGQVVSETSDHDLNRLDTNKLLKSKKKKNENKIGKIVAISLCLRGFVREIKCRNLRIAQNGIGSQRGKEGKGEKTFLSSLSLCKKNRGFNKSLHLTSNSR
jgi:hypothetical protein